MNTLVVALLTTTMVTAGAWFGAQSGGRQLLRRITILVFAWLLAIGTATLLYRCGWFQPLGLLTPVVAGLAVLLAVGFLVSRRWQRPTIAVPTGDRNLGILIGAACGFLIAAETWLLTGIAAGLVAPGPAATMTAATVESSPTAADDASPTAAPPLGDLLQSLARTANRGFVRHLPVLGEISGEVEATIYILNAPQDLRQRVAIEHDWQDLAELPAYVDLVADQELATDIRAFREGDLLALYRVQQNPRFLRFFMEPQVQALLPGLRPTALADRIRTAAPPAPR